MGTVGTANGIAAVEEADEIAREKLYAAKPNKKVARVITVIGYIFCVSMIAILLSLYYLFLWNPYIKAHRAAQAKAGKTNLSKVTATFSSDDQSPRAMALRSEDFYDSSIDKSWLKAVRSTTSRPFSSKIRTIASDNTILMPQSTTGIPLVLFDFAKIDENFLGIASNPLFFPSGSDKSSNTPSPPRYFQSATFPNSIFLGKLHGGGLAFSEPNHKRHDSFQ
eukprot:TCALIF_01697-PA protein Name:"Protein of unknown function" AED:0.05 eAED:0.05 QI:46/1/0.5/1/1/1/2/218/221